MSEFDIPGKFDIKGAGGISDLIDNAIIVWRNKRKEMSTQSKLPDPKLLEQPDCKLIVCKQRNGQWEGAIDLWYHPHSMSYSEDGIGQPKRYDLTKDCGALI
jgi:twinkle protein